MTVTAVVVAVAAARRATVTRRRLAFVAYVLVGAVGLAGCGTGRDTATSSADSISQQSPAVPAVPSQGATAATAAVTAPPPLDDAGPTEPATLATSDPASAEQARTRATAFLRAFARTDLDQQAWWAGVVGYFTPAAAPVYRSTDVANVPVHRVVEGSAELLPGTTRYRALVAVGTDVGAYTVTLVRAGGDWLVDRAAPPQ